MSEDFCYVVRNVMGIEVVFLNLDRAKDYIKDKPERLRFQIVQVEIIE